MDNLDRLLLEEDRLAQAEEQATDRLFGGLQRWGRAIFTGVVAGNIMDAMTRLNTPSLRVPLVDAVVDTLREVGFMGADIGRQQVSVSTLAATAVNWEAVNTDVLRWVMNYSYELVGGLTETTRDRLALELARFVQSGESMPKLIARLSDAEVGMFSKDRARRIAVTEVTRAYAEGNQAAWQAAGTQKIQWQTAMDEIVKRCPICWPMQGVVTEIGKPFQGGALTIMRPPAHVNCRCRIVPYIKVEVPEGWQPTYTTLRL